MCRVAHVFISSFVFEFEEYIADMITTYAGKRGGFYAI
jgi:hypothetical protein